MIKELKKACRSVGAWPSTIMGIVALTAGIFTVVQVASYYSVWVGVLSSLLFFIPAFITIVGGVGLLVEKS